MTRACGMGAVAIFSPGGGPDGWLLVLWMMRWRRLNGAWDAMGWKDARRSIAESCANGMLCLSKFRGTSSLRDGMDFSMFGL